MRDEDCYLRLNEQHHQQMMEEARLSRLLQVKKKPGRWVMIRERLGDLLINTGYRLKAVERPIPAQRLTAEGSH
ncbi:MAG TPA: hypothetical protein VHO48_06480 [Anaerolineaceae bacterium]|nr:hypothetical protein [Anaerolineaceae bacterium]